MDKLKVRLSSFKDYNQNMFLLGQSNKSNSEETLGATECRGKSSAFKGFPKQEVNPDWLMKTSKKRLQS